MTGAERRYAAAGRRHRGRRPAVELMKAWVDKARRPEVVGGIGGFAGLFDACALKAYDQPAARHLDRRRRHQGRHRPGARQARHDRLRPGRHGRRRPRRLRRRAAVPDRLHRHRQGRPRADRRDRQGHRRGLRRRPAARWSAARPPSTPACWRPTSTTSPASTTGVVEAAELLGPGPGPGRRRRGRDGVERPALQRLLPGPPRAARARPAGRSTAHVDELGRTLGEELLEPTRIYAKACLDAGRARPATHAMSHITGGGLAANLGPGAARRARRRRSTARPGRLPPVFDLVARAWAAWPSDDLERTLNCGVGMVALTRRRRRRHRDRRCSAGRGVDAWVAGEVEAAAGRRRGRVTLVGDHRLRVRHRDAPVGTGVRECTSRAGSVVPRER